VSEKNPYVFTRAYARLLGLAEEQAVEGYLAATSPGEPNPTLPETAEPAIGVSDRLTNPAEPNPPTLPETAEPALGVCDPLTNPAEPNPPTLPETAAPARGESGRAAASLPWRSLALFLLVVALSFATWKFHTSEPGTRVKHPVVPSSNVTASGSPPVSSLPSATKAPVSTPSVVTASFVLRIQARKTAWVLIKADGRKLAQQTLIGGAEKSVRAAHQIIVKTSNAGALDFEFNGQKLPRVGASGEVKTLEFGRSGLEVIISNPPTTETP
jgi:hypothetical protein